MTVVVDASVVVAALVDTSDVGTWATSRLARGPIAPHLLPAEVANVLRRLAIAGEISDDVATLAHADLLDAAIEYVPYGLVATRSWELRANVSAYDAWYVGVAELVDAPLATLDQRLLHATGPRCEFEAP